MGDLSSTYLWQTHWTLISLTYKIKNLFLWTLENYIAHLFRLLKHSTFSLLFNKLLHLRFFVILVSKEEEWNGGRRRSEESEGIWRGRISAQIPGILGSALLSHQGFAGYCLLPSTTTIRRRLVKEDSSYFLCTSKQTLIVTWYHDALDNF